MGLSSVGNLVVVSSSAHALAFSNLLVGSLTELGLRHASVSPGSRNTPLSLAFADEDRIKDWSHHDERSSAFFAMGIAKASRSPAALACTSGTAAAHFYPALIEARQAGVPLIVLTADRPPELRGVGAPQAIDQLKLYGNAVKWFHEAGVPDEAALSDAPSLALRLWSVATDDPPGPVHVNIPFREPLLEEQDPESRPVPALKHHPATISPGVDAVDALAEVISEKRTLLVCGASSSADEAAAVQRLSTAGDFVVFADPQSGLRSGIGDAGVVASSDLLVAAGVLERLTPEVVLRIGPLPTSKPLWQWLRDRNDLPQIYIDNTGGWREPLASALTVLRGRPAATLPRLTGRVRPSPPSWRADWLTIDAAAQQAVSETLAGEHFPNEPEIARTLADRVPAHALVYAGSSMPIRDLDAYAAPRDLPALYLGNRGANGIDGLLSSATGAAAALGRPTYALAGDLSALHDLSALPFAARNDVPVTFVVVNNDGGGIFHFLAPADPEAVPPEVFERHFGTSHGLDLVPIAAALGLEAHRCEDRADFAALIAIAHEHPRLIELKTDRKENVKVHQRVAEAVASRIGAL